MVAAADDETRCGAPHNLCFSCVQMQLIWLHPCSNVINAGRHAGLVQTGVSGSARTQELRVVGIEVWQRTMVSD